GNKLPAVRCPPSALRHFSGENVESMDAGFDIEAGEFDGGQGQRRTVQIQTVPLPRQQFFELCSPWFVHRAMRLRAVE
ncbi:MAG: hypothetical protein JWO80_4598, partial [Bryobacterales bacterium]|nr:hypothetical protein [Bryobacterales bacterium]